MLCSSVKIWSHNLHHKIVGQQNIGKLKRSQWYEASIGRLSKRNWYWKEFYEWIYKCRTILIKKLSYKLCHQHPSKMNLNPISFFYRTLFQPRLVSTGTDERPAYYNLCISSSLYHSSLVPPHTFLSWTPHVLLPKRHAQWLLAG